MSSVTLQFICFMFIVIHVNIRGAHMLPNFLCTLIFFSEKQVSLSLTTPF